MTELPQHHGGRGRGEKWGRGSWWGSSPPQNKVGQEAGSHSPGSNKEVSREEPSPEAGFRGHAIDGKDAFGSPALTHDAIPRITTLLFLVTFSPGEHSGGWVGLEGWYSQYICSATEDPGNWCQGLPGLEVTILPYLANPCARCTVVFCPYANNSQPFMTLFSRDRSVILSNFICMSCFF